VQVRRQLATYLILFAIVDIVIPVPILALVLGWVLWKRPPWFREWVREVYDDAASGPGVR